MPLVFGRSVDMRYFMLVNSLYCVLYLLYYSYMKETLEHVSVHWQQPIMSEMLHVLDASIETRGTHYCVEHHNHSVITHQSKTDWH